MNFDTTAMDAMRRRAGFLTVDQLMLQFGGANTLLDPFSILVSEGVDLGTGNTIYPGVRLRAEGGHTVWIGHHNVLYPGVLVEAACGDVRIGHRNEIGEGGFRARANRAGAGIAIGSDGRYQDGATVFGRCDFGDGCQVLGPVTVDDCVLEGGMDHRHPDAGERGGLLKGAGRAKGLTVPRGHVIAGQGEFDPGQMVPQTRYHPVGA